MQYNTISTDYILFHSPSWSWRHCSAPWASALPPGTRSTRSSPPWTPTATAPWSSTSWPPLSRRCSWDPGGRPAVAVDHVQLAEAFHAFDRDGNTRRSICLCFAAATGRLEHGAGGSSQLLVPQPTGWLFSPFQQQCSLSRNQTAATFGLKPAKRTCQSLQKYVCNRCFGLQWIQMLMLHVVARTASTEACCFVHLYSGTSCIGDGESLGF